MRKAKAGRSRNVNGAEILGHLGVDVQQKGPR